MSVRMSDLAKATLLLLLLLGVMGALYGWGTAMALNHGDPDWWIPAVMAALCAAAMALVWGVSRRT
jgi:hypothetical protein